MIFFFTGTGNSLYAAQSIAEVAGERTRSIAQAVHDEAPVYTDERIGIVCPVYSHDLPPLVKRFIDRSAFETPYFFVVLTYGNRTGGAQEIARRFLARHGIDAAYIRTLLMVDNWLPGYNIATERLLDKRTDEHLCTIADEIARNTRFVQPATADELAIYQAGIEKYGNLFERVDFLEGFLSVTDRCNGCGTCTRVCPSGCLRLSDDGAGTLCALRNAAAGSTCTACLACIHACPQHAISISLGELNGNAHFTNEHVSVADISDANNQAMRQR